MDDDKFSEKENNPNELIGPLLGMIARYRWWIIASAFIVPLAAIAAAFLLPDRYTSEAALVVVQQQVSQRYVDPMNTTSSADVVRGMKREILSGPRLMSIIDAFGLYPKLKATRSPDQLVEQMRKDVDIEPLDQIAGRSEFTAFKVAYTADSPRLAQEVTSRLTFLFIEVNMKERGSQASTTTRFLAEQLSAAKQRLDQQEKLLTDFKTRYASDSPEQSQANLGMLTDLRIQLQNTMSNQSRAQQLRLSLETALNGNLARLQSDRSTLLTRYTDKHPEILKKDQEIERVQALLTHLRTGSSGTPKPQDQAVIEDPFVAQLKGQVEANWGEAQNLNREEQRLRSDIAAYQGRLKLSPVREQQLAGLLRDYELYKQDYTDLQNKQLRSQMTANLEEQQPGQNFKLVDPPTLPSIPSSPKRLKISLGGAGAGLGFGFALALLMELRNRSYHTEKEVQHHLGAPLIVGIPVLSTTIEQRSAKRRKAFEWVAASFMFAIVAAAEYYVYLRG
ncbi:Wzz/FepE/Etk N-terminal domain-containing protein [Paludibaculum fermentans]|uniref:Wzz/FepE/Etk N-terminal domain-containing protein n=1 Tax=Paludibaculum fermentans TaxID=1473598 RepID=UPI003EB95B9D